MLRTLKFRVNLDSAIGDFSDNWLLSITGEIGLFPEKKKSFEFDFVTQLVLSTLEMELSSKQC